jgi:hypothetical protein
VNSEKTNSDEIAQLDVLYISPERFRASPQIGVPCVMEWSTLAGYLSRPSSGDAKDEAGGYSPALYQDNVRRKSALVSIGALVLDIDEAGDVDEVADALARYDAIVHETFSSTNDDPRCRALVRLAKPIDAATYERVHAIARAHLAAVGVVVDEGAKDASRLSYSPVRRVGAGYRFRVVHGLALDAVAIIAAQPPAPPPRAERLPRPEHRDAYVRGALERAAGAVSAASPGVRHYTLSKEAYGLARLGIGEAEIAPALLPAFVAAAGEAREYEGARTIRDAIKARRGVA